MTKDNRNLIVGLDIGTTKIACIVGEVTEDGVDIIGIGTAPSKGMRRGNVVNIDATVSSIRAAVDEAENMAARASPSMSARREDVASRDSGIHAGGGASNSAATAPDAAAEPGAMTATHEAGSGTH